MEMTDAIRLRIIKLYCLIFFLILLFRLYIHQFLFQVTPVFFYNKLDLTTWIAMATNLQRLILNNRTACIIADLIQSALPFVYLAVFLRSKKAAAWVGVLTVIVNFIYIPVFCSLPSGDSIQAHLTTLLFPLAFIPVSLSSFWFVFQGLRYFFLFFFASAGVYKVLHGGLFNIEQMSGILVYQHKEIILSTPNAPIVHFYLWLIAHKVVSYFLFLAAALAQLSFWMGFFTNKLDKWLAILLVLFLIMDSFLMRLHYWETLPVVITLIFSRYKQPANKLAAVSN